MELLRERDHAPIPNLHTDVVALTHTVLEMRHKQIEVEITVHNLQTRLERGADPHALRPLVLAVQQRNLGIDVDLLNLEARLNRLSGALAELAERQERQARKAALAAMPRTNEDVHPVAGDGRLIG